MEEQPLNRAHQEDRKAARYLQCRKFDEAVNCHLEAAKFLEEALTSTCIPRAIESLQLQKEYHVRQLQIISLKKAQLSALKTAIQSKLRLMAHANLKFMEGDQRENEPKNIQTEIFRTMEEADSLFELLVHRGDETQTPHSQEGNPDSSASSCQGKKKPKKDHVVIEELHTLNQQLRCFVEQLLTKLSVYEEENKKLKLRLKELENEHKGCSASSKLDKQNMQVITDSSAGNSSPFSQLSPEMANKLELPSLAPLEMPQFDYMLLNNSEKHSVLK